MSETSPSHSIVVASHPGTTFRLWEDKIINMVNYSPIPNLHKTTKPVHALGNGRLLAYGQGADIIQLFGPPYSSGTALKLRLAPAANRVESWAITSYREEGRAIWHHEVTSPAAASDDASGLATATATETATSSGTAAAHTVCIVTDFVDSDLPCLVRKLEVSNEIGLVIEPEPGVTLSRYPDALGGGLLVSVPAGHPVYGRYPSRSEARYRIVCRTTNADGAPSISFSIANASATLMLTPGDYTLLICGGPSYPEAIENMEAASALSYDVAYSRTCCYWDEYSLVHKQVIAELPDRAPYRETLAWAIDCVAVLIKTQQAVEGAVLAGYPYHLGYVRDCYGVLRGLLALRHFDEAKALLHFYRDTFSANGRIHNAQAAGVPGLFHIHEHDESEITGYLILGVMDYVAATQDHSAVTQMWPLLEWAWDLQLEALSGGMLPFNGDETYVAGGVLPRDYLDDGAAEATLLFIHSGKLLTQWASKHSLWSPEKVEAAQNTLQATELRFSNNFIVNGMLTANNPSRSSKLKRFRHGVCRNGHFGWTQLSFDGQYYCPECLPIAYADEATATQEPKEKLTRSPLIINSVGLAPVYFRSDLVPLTAINPLLQSAIDALEKSGSLPSRADGSVAVGYDLGMLLWNLVITSHPAAPVAYRMLLDLADETGAWAEYYDKAMNPVGTRYRPWESAINIEACLAYANADSQRDHTQSTPIA